MPKKLQSELKRLASSELVGNITKHLNGYEQKLKTLVKDFEVRSRDAREKSRVHLDKLSTQLKATRSDVEKKVTALLGEESKRLNRSVSEMVEYLKHVGKEEKAKLSQQAAGPSAKKRAAKAKSAAGPAPKKRASAKATKSKTKAAGARVSSAAQENTASQSNP